MEPRNLSFFSESCGGRLSNAAASQRAHGITTDSRAIRAGDLFVALKGDQFDGHDFLADVCAKGAVAALVEESRAAALPSGLPLIIARNTRAALGRIGAAYRAQFQIEAVAIAGSNGKTSTKEMLAAVLNQKFATVSSAASFNNDIGVPLTLLGLEQKHRAGVFEVGTNHPGELRPLLEMVRPRAGIITSIGREHLEFFGTLDGVLQEEGTLAEILPRDGFLVIDGDGYGADQLAERTEARVIRVGRGKQNDWRIHSAQMGREGSVFQIETDDAECGGEYRMKLLGAHQVVNATCALVVGRNLGLGRAEIQRGLASCAGARRRLELKRIDGFLVLDDAYNANADSMQAALDTLEQFPCSGRRIAILGDMAELGETSRAAHEEIGRRAADRRIDFLIAVGRSSSLTAGAAREAGLREVVELNEVEKAGPLVTELVRPGDVVLIKASRSSRLERVVDFLAAHFDSDRREAAA